jgi:lipid II:glycine glycyltransferase (peptidoglycan interpeptide bridge formation enzyme)
MLSGSGFSAYHNVTGNYTDTVVINLEKGIDEIESTFAPSLRRQIRKARACDSTLQKVTDRKALHAFLELTRGFYRQRGIGFPRTETLGCYLGRKILECGEGLVLEMIYEGKPVAGIAVIACGNRAIFSYGYSNDEPSIRYLPLSHLLHFEAISWAARNSYRLYDFGGYSRGGKADGINRFKLGFSDTIETVSGDYLYTFNPLLTATVNLLGRLRKLSRQGFV